MVEATAAIISSIIAGLAGGFLSSWMAFNASGEKFDGRKHGNALITGALTGVAFGVASALSNPEESDNASFIVTLVTIFFGAAGIDRLRSSGGHMITKENIAKLRAKKETETQPPASTTEPATKPT